MSLKKFTILYFSIAIVIVTLYLYLYNLGLLGGKMFHELSALERNMIRALSVLKLIIAPFSSILTFSWETKPMFNQSIWWDILQYIGIIPSFLLYARLFFGYRIVNRNEQ